MERRFGRSVISAVPRVYLPYASRLSPAMRFFSAIRNKRLKLTAWKLLEPFFNVQYIFAFDLASAKMLDSSARQLPPGVRLRIVCNPAAAELPEICALLSEAGMPRWVVQERLARGDVLGIAVADEELAAYTWATFSRARIAEARRSLRLLQDQAVQYDTLVMPWWRGKGLQYRLTAAVLQHLSAVGYRQTLAWVNSCNVRSLRNQLSQGKRKIATIWSSPILGLAWVHPLTEEVRLALEKTATPD